MRKLLGALFLVAVILGGWSLSNAQDCTCHAPGDLTGDTFVDVSDLAALVDFAFQGGPTPYSDPGCPLIHAGDINCDGRCNLVDVVILIDMIFNGREAPCNVCSGPNPECSGSVCGSYLPCNEPNDCSDPVCATTSAGGGVCVEGSTPCASLFPCVDGNCPPGYICIVNSCCVDPVCVPESAFCEQLPPGSQRTPQPPRTDDGPTLGGPSR
ncbi:MAG: hypothetical protein AB1752_11585 [Candidatus Zixiibacteriota bacterium]